MIFMNKIFIITIVDEKEIAIARYIEVNDDRPKEIPIMYAIVVVNIICPIPVISATLPTSFITLGFRPRPTINKSTATPI